MSYIEDTASRLTKETGGADVNMNLLRVWRERCKTVACHGAWTAISILSQDKPSWTWIEENETESTLLINGQRIPFANGSALLSAFLFSGPPDDLETLCQRIRNETGLKRALHDRLRQWAANNPDLWGNKYGNRMFDAKIAFTGKPRSAARITTQDIARHWSGVADRIKAHEREAAAASARDSQHPPCRKQGALRPA